ncbi:CCA tRNA nucleotidyltransferase [Neobacillus sp. D3-1R]|uniref:CCA tRNA nucleotidyltransferase n=1 Tax=Neobacillus sp. D3-1R TaxID=3445778 RepID=UPI003F9F49FE
MIKAFQQAIPILEKIESFGYEAYFVGGSVRDYLLNKEIDDVDIATSATPEEIKMIFSKTVDVGIEHGTVLVLYNGQTYEITTFRSEAEYEDFRRPKSVQFIRSLYEDLKRRDFTMNAIAMNRNGHFIDPFLGNEAIRDKRVQTVGKAEERFSEDALRMMRAIRFVSQLSFSVEEETFKALKRNGHLLENISTERKTKEFEKLLTGKNRNVAFQILLNAELLPYLPGLKNKNEAFTKLSQLHCDQLQLIEMWTLLSYLLNMVDKEVMAFLKEWKLSNQKIKDIQRMMFFLYQRFEEKWSPLSMYHAGEVICMSTEKVYNILNGKDINEHLHEVKQSYQQLPIKDRGDLAVTGQDLMAWTNQLGGPWLRELLETIEKLILHKQLKNDKEAIKEWLLSCNPK